MLDRKLWRDIGRLKAQLVAIVLVVAAGVAAFVSMLSVHSSFEQIGLEYYRSHRFADVFVQVQRAPVGVAGRIRDLPGVSAVSSRIVKDVTLDVPGMPEPGVARLISIPADGQPRLGQLYLRRGRWIAPGRSGEVMVGEAFAEAHGLEPGDELTAIIAGRRQRLRIVGIALSPEYVYQIPPGAMFPDDKRFGVFWMEDRALAAAFDMEGAFNDLIATVRPDASTAEVLDRIDRITEPYGGRGAHERDRQVSARFVSEELEQLETMGAAMPTIFLGVAAFLLNVVMARLVSGQREQIAALKALGYGDLSIGLHYTKLIVVVSLGGTALGGALGGMMGSALIGVYQEFFRFPLLSFRLDLGVLLVAAVLSIAAGFVGTFRAVRRALALPPAEAMRPPAPAVYHHSLLERIGLGRLLTAPGRIVLRNLSRHPLRAASSTLGISMAVAILVSGNFGQDAMSYIMSVNFQLVQREDLTVHFDRPISSRAVRELEHMPGVVYAEPARDLPVRVWSGQRNYETGLQGLPRAGKLRRILDIELDPVAIPAEGVLLTRELAQRLDVGIGDEITLEILEDEQPHRSVEVAGLVDEMLGLNAYMDIRAVSRLMREGDRVTGARLMLDPSKREQVYREIKTLPHVAGATLRTAAYDIFDETMAQMQLVTATILTLFASVVAVGVVYNGARVVLAERSRELASLRVLGFTRAEISTILLGELGVQILFALPLGCVLGYLFAYGAISGIDTELYRFPLVISPRTYAFAVTVVLVVGIGTALIVRRKLDHLDLIEVLKTRE